jgi:NAD+ kinase
LKKNKIEVQLFKPFNDFLVEEMNLKVFYTSLFTSPSDFDAANRFIFSVGGDGTFLHSVVNIRNFDIPVVGVNSGRLGFLADISQEQVHSALTDIFNNRYSVIERALLEVEFLAERKQLISVLH